MKRFFWILVLLPASAFGWNYEKVGSVHFFRIDPKEYRMDLLLATDYGASAMTAKRYRERSGAALVINGGFFDEAYRPLGLLVRKGVVLNPIRNAEWGVFWIPSAKPIPRIVHRRDFKPDGVETAIQVGPRLVIDGKVPSLKETIPERRSALGVTAAGEILVAISEAPIGMKEWAQLLQVRVPAALNLDGGGSSQLSVSVPGLSLEVAGETNVPNAVAFFPGSRDP